MIPGSEATQNLLTGHLIASKPMTFPDSPRVIYNTNPLEEVICQLKFPPILKIESVPPATFQDEIRSTYPLFQDIPGTLIDVPPEIAKMLPGLTGTKSY